MTVTIKDVAARAGVSFKTVSNVINGHPYVTAEMRERVNRAVADLGYRPNISARRMRRANVGVIALAIPDLANTYFADLGRLVSTAAEAYSYTTLIENTTGKRDAELLVARGLRPHLIDGLILSPLELQKEDMPQPGHGIPIVLIGEHLIGSPFDHVMIDNVAAARIATTHLIAMGRRRIAYIGLQDTVGSEATQLRLQGYREALEEAGATVDPRLLVSGGRMYRRDGVQGVRYLLSLDQPPDAIFCFNDMVALGAIRALYDAGLRVPDDVAVVGFDDTEAGAFSVPSLTTISPDKVELCRLAVSLLIARIQRKRTGAPELVQPAFQLVVRESTVGAYSHSDSQKPPNVSPP